MSYFTGQGVVRAFFAKTALSKKDKFKNGMRYEYTFLIDTTLLFMKSYATYKFLRESKMLPLPSPSTRRRLYLALLNAPLVSTLLHWMQFSTVKRRFGF